MEYQNNLANKIGLPKGENYNKAGSKNAPGPFDLGKIPPQAVDLEEAVLGALLLEREALTSVIDILRPEGFYKADFTRNCKILQNFSLLKLR